MRARERGSFLGGALLALFGVVWVGALLAAIVAGTLEEGARPALTLLMLLFAAPGLLFLRVGLALLWGRREVFLERERVSVRERRLRRWESWSQPLSAYAGASSASCTTRAAAGTSRAAPRTTCSSCTATRRAT